MHKNISYYQDWASRVVVVAEFSCQCRRRKRHGARSLVWEDPLEEGTATHSRILAGRIPRTEEPGGLQSIGLHRVRHD